MLFKSRKQREMEFAQTVATAVAQAVGETLKEAQKPKLDDFGGFYEKTLGGMAQFLNGASDVALRGAASALGQRGGRRTQQRKRERLAAAQSAPTARSCKLCRDSHARNLTVDDILEHRKHEYGHSNSLPSESAGRPAGVESPDDDATDQRLSLAKIGFNGPVSA